MRKKLLSTLAKLSLTALAASPAAAAVRVLQGTAFYEGDPGPISDSYWVSGQYKYDPNGYLEREFRNPEYHLMTVYGDHPGKANCVFRRRVAVSDWEFRHPHVRVCRMPPGNER